MHECNSNVPELRADMQFTNEGQSYAKEHLGLKPNEAKLLGLPWDTKEDTLAVTFSRDSEEATKREVQRNLASVYDPLRVESPVTVLGKMNFTEAGD